MENEKWKLAQLFVVFFSFTMKIINRNRDYIHYISSLFLPVSARNAAWGIRAFNVELAQIRENVTHMEHGRLKLVWWNQSVDELFKVIFLVILIFMEIKIEETHKER